MFADYKVESQTRPCRPIDLEAKYYLFQIYFRELNLYLHQVLQTIIYSTKMLSENICLKNYPPTPGN